MALGRGLDSLIPKKITTLPTTPLPDKPDETFGGERILQIPVSQISVNPQQPRREFKHSALEDLTNSIKQHGIIQPLVVTKTPTGYELIAGERRWRAAGLLNLSTVPAIVRQATDNQKLELAIIENVQRENLNPIEEAASYQRLIEEFSLTQEEVANKVGKSRSVVTNALRLLNLPENIQQAIMEGKVSPGHAKVLAGIVDPTAQTKLFERILRDSLTVRETEKAVRLKNPTKTLSTSAQYLDYETQLRQALGTKVNIVKDKKGGKIMIDFYADEELSDLVNKII